MTTEKIAYIQINKQDIDSLYNMQLNIITKRDEDKTLEIWVALNGYETLDILSEQEFISLEERELLEQDDIDTILFYII